MFPREISLPYTSQADRGGKKGTSGQGGGDVAMVSELVVDPRAADLPLCNRPTIY